MGHYVGHLPENDQLYEYLRHEIQPQMGWAPPRPRYRVFRLNGSNDVYLYEEKYSGMRVVGKFFLSNRAPNGDAAARRLSREKSNLETMRSYGFTGGPHYIARPLGRNDDLNKLLVVEHCGGELLSSIIERSIRTGDRGLLFGKLTALAYFLASFHNRTAIPHPVNFDESCTYLDCMTQGLREGGMMDWNEKCELDYWRDHWRRNSAMWEDCLVYAHGDATPENFLFGDGLSVISFDLERLRRSDRVYDTGRIAGELKHFFLRATGNRFAAEPFIGHFLWEYACHFPDRDRAFRAMARRVPFYMGITLLRIARNAWLDAGHRRNLIHEAKECLRGGS